MSNLTPEQREHIDRLCETMDREHIPAGMWFPPGEPAYPPGGTILDCCRARWIERAQQGLPLPEHWHDDDERITKELRERFEKHGTREWRKAYPWMAEHVASVEGQTSGEVGA